MKNMIINENLILTLRPDGRPGIRMTKEDYTLLADFIVSCMQKHKELTIQELIDTAALEFDQKFRSNTGWYALAVKLDLQARGRIKIVQKRDPYRLKRTLSLRLKKLPTSTPAKKYSTL